MAPTRYSLTTTSYPYSRSHRNDDPSAHRDSHPFQRHDGDPDYRIGDVMTDTAKPTITLQQIRDAGPCEIGWRKLNKALGNPDMARKISIGDVVLSNGLDDALWCLRVLPPRERVTAVMPSVRRASARTSDPRVDECIADIDRWLAGDDSVDMQSAAASAAKAAFLARDTAARSAAQSAAGAAEAAAAGAAAGAAASAWASAWASASASAAVAWTTERKQQRRDLLDMFPPLVLTEGKAK